MTLFESFALGVISGLLLVFGGIAHLFLTLRKDHETDERLIRQGVEL